MNPRLMCLGLAMLTGTMYTIGVAVVSVPNHRARASNKTLSSCCAGMLTAIYVLLMVAANIPLVLATSYGPVAVVVPVAIAFYMLTNMVLQVCMGMSNYDKTMQVGTVVLAIAAIQLVDVGPLDPVEQADPVKLIEEPVAIAWLSVLLFILVSGLVTLPKVIKQGRDSVPKLLSFTAVVGAAAAINNSLSKTLTVIEGPAFGVCIALYIVLGATSSISSAVGNAGLNNAISVPAMSCLQVIANGLTGVFVWGDSDRLSQPTAYVGVYLLFCLGVYLCTSADHVAGLFRWHEFGGKTDFLKHITFSAYGKAMDDVFIAMRDAHRGNADTPLDNRGEADGSLNTRLVKAFEAYLNLGSLHHTMGEKELQELCNLLVERMVELDLGRENLVPVLATWFEKYCIDYKYVSENDAEFSLKVHNMACKRSTRKSSMLKDPLLSDGSAVTA